MERKLTLTAIEPEDLDLLYTIENDPQMWLVGDTNAPYSRYVLRDYIANQRYDIYADKQVRFVIRVDGKAVGLIDLFDFAPQHLRAEMGVAILKAERGKGYAEEAVRQLLSYCGKVLHLHQVYSIVSADNNASLAMLRAADFTEQAMLKEWLLDAKGWKDAKLMSIQLD